MKVLHDLLDFRDTMPAGAMKPTVVMVGGTALVVVHRYVGSMPFSPEAFNGGGNSGALLLMFAAAFVLFGLLPALTVRMLFRERLADYGLRAGDWRTGMRMVAVSYPVIALAMLLPAAFNGEMRDFYPFDKEALASWGAFARLEASRVLLYYTAWEFLFRGFMLFGLTRATGPWIAITVQTIPSCLWHIGLPTGEIVSSIAGGFLFGIMAVRTGSIVWPLLLHCLIGLTLDLFIVLTT